MSLNNKKGLGGILKMGIGVKIICLFIGYAFGCIQTAYITGRVARDIDIREHGSGNAGMTNVLRTIGRRAGIIVFFCDVLKAVLAFVIASLIFNGGGSFFAESLPLQPGLYAGLGVVLGHNFPFFLRFKGGKGIAATLGVMLALDWRAAVIVYVVAAILIAITKYISLGSITMVLLFPALLLVFGHHIETLVIMLILAAMAIFLHRGNVQRLLAGTERKLELWRKKAKE